MSYHKHLKSQGLLPSTRQQYLRIMGRVDQDPIAWLHNRIHARTPIGTILPLRAAVKHYLISEHGYNADELSALLPKAKGRPGKLRDALSPTQLALYYVAAEEQGEPMFRNEVVVLAALAGVGVMWDGSSVALTPSSEGAGS